MNKDFILFAKKMGLGILILLGALLVATLVVSAFYWFPKVLVVFVVVVLLLTIAYLIGKEVYEICSSNR